LFRLDSSRIYRASALEALPWLDHGFGTRESQWPPAATVSTLRQIHSGRVLMADRSGDLGEGDALISNRPGITLAIRTADCLPILIADSRNRAVAAVHAGWRGTVAGITSNAIQSMAENFGSKPEDLLIAIGPGIGACCFEVGPEVAGQFSPFFPERDDLSGRAKIDLVETTYRQLCRNGIGVGQMFHFGLCSSCLPDKFYSYRRDRDSGRMISTIGVR
jgi:YfiH family protein